MNRLLLLPALLAVGLSGCPTDGGELADLTFEPPVDDRNTATVDLGDVPVGSSPPASATIIATNNSDEEIVLGVDCDDIAGTPFNISCPATLTIPPLGSEDGTGAPDNTGAIGGALLAGPNDVGEVTAVIFLDRENRIYSFTLRANITP